MRVYRVCVVGVPFSMRLAWQWMISIDYTAKMADLSVKFSAVTQTQSGEMALATSPFVCAPDLMATTEQVEPVRVVSVFPDGASLN